MIILNTSAQIIIIIGGITLGLLCAVVEGFLSQIHTNKPEYVDYDLREARNKVCFFLFGYSE